MSDWTALLKQELCNKLGDNLQLIEEKCGWVPEIAEKAKVMLTPEFLSSISPEEVYNHIKELGISQCPIKLTNLGRVNDAQRVVDSLLKLLSTPGGLSEKYRAAKFPQAGIVTITELLCVARPLRFICRNTAFTREFAKIIPLYSKKALDELPYEEFLDLCRELCKILEEAPGIAGEWAKKYRYLLLYAAVTAK